MIELVIVPYLPETKTGLIFWLLSRLDLENFTKFKS